MEVAVHPQGRHHPIATLVLCLAIVALEGYGVQALGVAAPHMMAELKLGPAMQGWLSSAAMFGLVIGSFGGGYLSERIGRRSVLAGSVILFGLFSIATALARRPDLLFGVRLLAGVGFGGATPILLTIASEVAPPRWRALSVTATFCGLPAGSAIVALFAASMGERMNWREIFVLGGVAPLLVTPLVLWLIPSRPAATHAVSPRPISDLFGGGRALGTFLIWTAFVVTLAVVYLMLNWLPTLVVSKGLTQADGAAAAFAFNIASIAGGLCLAPLVDRYGLRWPLFIAYLLLAACVALMSVSDQAGVMLTLSALAGFLAIGPQCALYALIPVVYPAHARVLGSGAAAGVGRFGSIVGLLVAGELRAGGMSANQVFLILSPIPLIAAFAVFVLGAMSIAAQGRSVQTRAKL